MNSQGEFWFQLRIGF